MNDIKNLFLVTLLTIIALSCQRNNSSSVEQRIDSLVNAMTLEEKIGQMNQLTGEGVSDNMKKMIRTGQVGTLLNELDVTHINELQRIAVEESRLKIPLIIARDVIHGFKTIFPIPLGQASSWNPEIARQGARIAAIEASSVGIRWTFAPMIDITRDPRWGRIAESLGEDPLLTSTMGAAMIEGFQGDSLSNPTSIAACAKHFAAYGATEGGKDYNTTWVPELQLRELYLPPFEAAVKAGAATFMCSFNDINGIPSSGNKHLNLDILRNEWQFDGVLVSDWGSIDQMISHGFSADLKEAALAAANAGVDIDMMGFAFINELPTLVKEGKVKESTIDAAVRNILRLKFRLGLFENPYTPVVDRSKFYLAESLESAKKAAIEGAVLLKNENEILPLSTSIKRLAVIGPLADSPIDQVGTWCFDAEPEHCITPLAALRNQYGATMQIDFIQTLTHSRDHNQKHFQKALAAAQRADAVVVFVGEESVLSGEARCRADISLPGAQSQLIAALKKSGKPFIMIVMTGRPLTLEQEINQSNATLLSFHAGTMTGPAIADLLFGKAVPSGKLPITMPRMVGQIPVYYNHKQTGRPAKDITLIDDIEVGAAQTSLGFTSYHLDAGTDPLFPFGFGLSYTSFEYGTPVLSAQQINTKQTLSIECTITNKGKYDAYEVAQLYVRDLVGSLVRPVKELKGFKKILIKAGEKTTVRFEIGAHELSFWKDSKTFKPEVGTFHLWVAPSSQTGAPVAFELID